MNDADQDLTLRRLGRWLGAVVLCAALGGPSSAQPDAPGPTIPGLPEGHAIDEALYRCLHYTGNPTYNDRANNCLAKYGYLKGPLPGPGERCGSQHCSAGAHCVQAGKTEGSPSAPPSMIFACVQDAAPYPGDGCGAKKCGAGQHCQAAVCPMGTLPGQGCPRAQVCVDDSGGGAQAPGSGGAAPGAASKARFSRPKARPALDAFAL